jgi:hypothetical protein
MGKLTDEERQTMAALLAKADEEDDFEVEIFSGDKGARLPYSQAKDWLAKEFGIGPAPAGGQGAPQGGQGAPQGGQGAPRPLSLFRGRGGGQGAPQGGQGAPQGGQGAPQGGQGQQG